MDKFDYLLYVLIYLLAGAVAIMSRSWKLLNNKKIIARNNNGEINWSYERVYFFVNMLIGGFVGIGTYLLLDYLKYINDINLVIFISCLVATASGEVFSMLQAKVVKTVEEMSKEDLGINKNKKG